MVGHRVKLTNPDKQLWADPESINVGAAPALQPLSFALVPHSLTLIRAHSPL